jgi:serine/threonine-protein kinase RsbW
MAAPADFRIREEQLTELLVESDLRRTREPESRILNELGRCRFSEESTFAVKLALEEALTNAVKHGNKNDGSKRLRIRFYVDRHVAVIAVSDEGGGFRPEDVPDPTADENLERPNGRGIMLMQAYMTKVRFNPAGNEVWMLKENRAEPARAPEGG